MKARYPRWSRQYRAVYALRYAERPLAAWWRRMTACPDCHGTGVIMYRECTCGGTWMSGHEAHCGEDPCPWLCDLVRDKSTAARIWSWWLA
jgi:RecJ-like exonuclease